MLAERLPVGQARSVRFGREEAKFVIDDIGSLMREHWEEVGHYRDIPLDPDFSKYRQAELAGTLRIYTARVIGVLIGYAVYFVGPALHYKTVKLAQQATLFLAPEQRRGTLGWRFIRWSEEQLRMEGVRIISQHVKKRRDFGSVLERHGYELQDYVYTKRLDL